MRTFRLAALAFAVLVGAQPALAVEGDADNDGVPDSVEPSLGLNPSVKDNDIYGSASLFAMQQYRDFLGREGDSGGIQYYADGISSGSLSRAQAIENFFNSPEFSGSVSPIVRLYFATFLRVPDYAGLTFQVDAYRGGAPLDGIATNFTASPEFQQRYGSLNNRDFVTLLYQNILGRTASSGEIDFHASRLDSGVSRGAVLVGFSESPEYQQLTANEVYVTMMYVGMLRRAPEASGFSYWVNYMDSGNPGLALIAGFLNAPEYNDRFMPPPNLTKSQQLLGGTWTFQFTTTMAQSVNYTFTSIDPPNASGDYPALGTDGTGNAVIGGYLNGRAQWGVFDPEASVDRVFLFTFTSANQVTGCYHEIPSGQNPEDLGTCYPMTGTRS